LKIIGNTSKEEVLSYLDDRIDYSIYEWNEYKDLMDELNKKFTLLPIEFDNTIYLTYYDEKSYLAYIDEAYEKGEPFHSINSKHIKDKGISYLVQQAIRLGNHEYAKK